jgi:hypothetical protein
MFCELYEAIIDGIPVTCQIADVCYDTGLYCVRYINKDGKELQKWVNPDILAKTPQQEISQ